MEKHSGGGSRGWRLSMERRWCDSAVRSSNRGSHFGGDVSGRLEYGGGSSSGLSRSAEGFGLPDGNTIVMV